MNMNETQQAMESDQYKTLYEYLGKSAKGTDLPGMVARAARNQGIEIKFKHLTQATPTSEYTGVYSYPIWFLDQYFEANSISIEARTKLLNDVMSRLDRLEARISQAEKLAAILSNHVGYEPPTKEPDYEDDLPF